jgi:diguanylate cyclase (GGDEF)-like protein
VGASARRRRAGCPPAGTSGAAAPEAPAPAPAWPGWRLAALAFAWPGLGVVWLLRPTFRPADAAAFAVLLALAALGPMAGRRAAGGREWPGGELVEVWTVPAALLLPPGYALVAHLPLCLLPRGARRRVPAAWADLAGERGGRPMARGSWRLAEAVALGVAGAAASWLHGLLAPASGPYTAATLVGSPPRLAALAAAVTGYALARWLLVPGDARSWAVQWPVSPGPASRLGAGRWYGVMPGPAPHRTAELCAAVGVATLWAANPLLVLAAAPPVLLLARSLPADELLAAARTDPKTRLANAAWWREVAEAELARTRRAGRPLSVLLVDIDHFKQVNDRHGHLFGDTVLSAVADALRSATRPWDLVGRFGGEEFVVLLADVDLATAAEIAERIRHQVAAVRCSPDAASGAAVSVTVSVGAASCPPPADLASALAAADAALYRAKAAGRDRVELASDQAAREPGTPGPVPAQASRPEV